MTFYVFLSCCTRFPQQCSERWHLESKINRLRRTVEYN